MRGEGEVESFASDGHVIIRCTACRTKFLYSCNVSALRAFLIAGILLVHCGIGCRLSVAVVMGHPPVVCV